MKIEAVDFYYLAMPQVLNIADGSQDALLVRVQAGADVGWGECEAAPLVSIASYICPPSHSACQPVQASVIGQNLDNPADIYRIGDKVRAQSLDLLQADHTLSGIDIAMWDLLARRNDVPVYELLGYKQAYPKTPYASQLFGDTPQQTLEKGRQVRQLGFRAAKFGWGPFGQGSVAEDTEQLTAAREGLGPDGILLVDAGTIWNDNLEAATARLAALNQHRAVWLEEPFVTGALNAYRHLAARSGAVKIAGGEGCHNYFMAEQMLDHAGLGYIQIDTGRVGGISIAHRIAAEAQSRGVTYVNHTFTSHLALSASLQPFAGLEEDTICEYPVEAKPVADAITIEHLLPDQNGQICLPERPGLGMTINFEAARKYLVDVEIKVGGKLLYRTPEFSA